MKNDNQTGVTGFDGQELPKEYAGNTNLELKYDKTLRPAAWRTWWMLR